jgi:hypothetical protein
MIWQAYKCRDLQQALNASSKLHCNINGKLFKLILSNTRSPTITTSYYATWFPVVTERYATNWKKLRQPCNSQKLFLAEVLPKELTRVIYIDADTIFFVSPHLLWNEFAMFQRNQVLGISVYRSRGTNTLWQYDIGKYTLCVCVNSSLK